MNITSITEKRNQKNQENAKVLMEKMEDLLNASEETEAVFNRNRMRKRAGLSTMTYDDVTESLRKTKAAREAYDEEFRNRVTYQQRVESEKQNLKTMMAMTPEERAEMNKAIEAEFKATYGGDPELDMDDDFGFENPYTEEEEAAFWANYDKTGKHEDNGWNELVDSVMDTDPALKEKIDIRKAAMSELD